MGALPPLAAASSPVPALTIFVTSRKWSGYRHALVRSAPAIFRQLRSNQGRLRPGCRGVSPAGSLGKAQTRRVGTHMRTLLSARFHVAILTRALLSKKKWNLFPSLMGMAQAKDVLCWGRLLPSREVLLPECSSFQVVPGSGPGIRNRPLDRQFHNPNRTAPFRCHHPEYPPDIQIIVQIHAITSGDIILPGLCRNLPKSECYYTEIPISV